MQTTRNRWTVLTPIALILALAVPASALADSTVGEQQQGAQVLSQIRHGTLNPKNLASMQYQDVGEYLMGQALGSTDLHQRMNAVMDQMMGSDAADQMHMYLGKRYLGINVAPSSQYGNLYGLMGVMMSGYRGSALAGMMGAYLNGQGTAGYMMGPGMMGYSGYPYGTSSGGGWPTGAVVAVAILGAVLLAAVLAFAAPRLRGHQHTTTTTG